MDRNTVVFIPTFHCAAQVSRLIPRVAASLPAEVREVWIIDNASADETAEAARTAVSRLTDPGTRAMFRVRINASNLGLGGSFKHAFLKAKAEGFTSMILLHGDDQADPRDIPCLIAAANEAPEAAAIFGARFMKGSRRHNYSWVRTAGNRALAALYSLACGRKIPELGSGLNFYRLSRFSDQEIRALPDHIAFDAVFLLNVVGRGLDHRFVPISWHQKDQRSNAQNLAVGWDLLKIILSWVTARRRTRKCATQILMPMAGEGRRFRRKGIGTTKPLIPVDGVPMFKRAFSSLKDVIPKGSVAAILNSRDPEAEKLRAAIERFIPAAQCFFVTGTRGPLDTCLRASGHLDPQGPLLILDCDLEFEDEHFIAFVNEIWRHPPGTEGALLCVPSSHPQRSYVRVLENRAVAIAEKQVISEHAIIGAYYFRHAGRFISLAQQILNSNSGKGREELFISDAYRALLEEGGIVPVFHANFYRSFGSPEEMAAEEESLSLA